MVLASLSAGRSGGRSAADELPAAPPEDIFAANNSLTRSSSSTSHGSCQDGCWRFEETLNVSTDEEGARGCAAVADDEEAGGDILLVRRASVRAHKGPEGPRHYVSSVQIFLRWSCVLVS